MTAEDIQTVKKAYDVLHKEWTMVVGMLGERAVCSGNGKILGVTKANLCKILSFYVRRK